MRIVLALCALMMVLRAQPVNFTGNVGNDFPASSTFISDPGMIDVGMPLQFPTGTVSGWDMQRVAVSYDPAGDRLYIGFDTYGIAGDADGDGDPNSTGSVLSGLGGVDQPSFSSTESAGAFFDLNNDGNFDIVVGISGATDVTGVQTALFSGTIFAAAFAYGAPLPNATTVFTTPNAAAPDLEISVDGFSNILNNYLTPGQTSIRASFFMGSFSDAGIGEDYVPEPTPIMLPVSLFCTGTPATATDLGPGCNVPGAPVLVMAPPAQGTTGMVSVSAPAHPGAHVWLFGSIGPVTVYRDPASGCDIFVDIFNPSNLYTIIDDFLDANGNYSRSYDVPIVPAAVGETYIFQARIWALNGPIPGGDWPSNGMGLTVGCP